MRKWERNFAERQLIGKIYRRVMLRMSPGTWGKEFPVAAADSGQLDPADPRKPTLRVRAQSVVVSLPSHDPSYAPYLDTLVRRNAEALRSADRLIIDVRGNEGGSSWMSDVLMPYVRSEHQRPDNYAENDAVLLSSPDQVAYARRAFGSDTSAFVRSLVTRMAAHPGELVPMRDPAAPPDPERPDSVVKGPRRVGVLVDRGTVSASEVLVLRALRSERATVFGENSAGALDYQSASIVSLAPGERRWYLGYPTITRVVPAGGKRMRGVGIPPDVRVDWRAVADPIGYVERALAP